MAGGQQPGGNPYGHHYSEFKVPSIPYGGGDKGGKKAKAKTKKPGGEGEEGGGNDGGEGGGYGRGKNYGQQGHNNVQVSPNINVSPVFHNVNKVEVSHHYAADGSLQGTEVKHNGETISRSGGGPGVAKQHEEANKSKAEAAHAAGNTGHVGLRDSAELAAVHQGSSGSKGAGPGTREFTPVEKNAATRKPSTKPTGGNNFDPMTGKPVAQKAEPSANAPGWTPGPKPKGSEGFSDQGKGAPSPAAGAGPKELGTRPPRGKAAPPSSGRPTAMPSTASSPKAIGSSSSISDTGVRAVKAAQAVSKTPLTTTGKIAAVSQAVNQNRPPAAPNGPGVVIQGQVVPDKQESAPKPGGATAGPSGVKVTGSAKATAAGKPATPTSASPPKNVAPPGSADTTGKAPRKRAARKRASKTASASESSP